MSPERGPGRGAEGKAGSEDGCGADGRGHREDQNHDRISACSGNSVLTSLLDSLSGPTSRAWVWRGLTQEGSTQRTLAEHRAILDALGSHDPMVARSWSTVHIASVQQWLASVL